MFHKYFFSGNVSIAYTYENVARKPQNITMKVSSSFGNVLIVILDIASTLSSCGRREKGSNPSLPANCTLTAVLHQRAWCIPGEQVRRLACCYS